MAVAEIVKDMAPAPELFLATTATTADTQAAIDWFVANGVHIVTRSLGAPYDGPGDGTGPLDAVVDYAAARGITWFNSGGNDAASGYGRYTDGVDANGYVDFQNGPGVDTVLRIDPSQGGVAFDGIRWANDWYLPPGQVTDYSVEISQGTSEFAANAPGATWTTPRSPARRRWRPSTSVFTGRSRAKPVPAHSRQRPLLAVRARHRRGGDVLRFDRGRSPVDCLQLGQTRCRLAQPIAAGSRRNRPADGSSGIAFYSSQGPTNDGRVKPDITAPSCVASTIYSNGCFNGTSAASPAAAGMAALLLGQGLAAPGMPLAALTRHLVRDLGPPGADNAYGAGEILLPAPPIPVSPEPSKFTSLGAPVRLLDTRPSSFVGPANLVGPYPQFSIIDLPISSAGVIPPTATSVAVNVTSTDSTSQFYVQALPTLGGAIGTFSTINVAIPGQIRPNFAVVPLGQGSISIFIPTGGNIIVDAMGYFTPSAATAAGRFVPINPHRALDTRPSEQGPVPTGWVAHQPAASEAVRVEVPASAGVPAAGVSALVVNVTATEPVGAGYLQALPTGTPPGGTSNVNYATGETAATHAIVPLGADGTISVFTSNASHIVVDIMGYITDGSAPVADVGRFVPITPTRYYDSRSAPGAIHAGGSTVAITLAGAAFAAPAGAAAISMNLTSDQATGSGYLTVYPSDGAFPLSSNLNFVAATPVANAGLVKLSGGGTLNAFVNVATHVIIDVNGYFTGTQ